MIELSLRGSTADVGVAGDTLNTAIYLKREAPEVTVDYITCLGDDPFSDQIEDFIQQQGIGTGAIQRIPGKSPGLYAITTSETGERSFTYWRSAAAARDLFQTDGGTNFDCLAAYDLIYFSGISIAILPHEVRLALLHWLAHHSTRFAYDSNYRPRLWEDANAARQVTQALWARADIALPSIDDEMDLFEESAQAVTQRFENGGNTGALKRGEVGPLSLGSPVAQSYTAAPHVIDTTAAGDSFNGGYLAGILTGKTQAEALMQGHTCAARVVQHRGAIIPREVA